MVPSVGDWDEAKPEQWFPGWEAVLAREESCAEQRAWTREIVGRFLADCTNRGEPVSVPAARAFVDREILRWRPEPGELEGWKSGLNWFFREGKRRRRAAFAQAPALTVYDQGETEWERRLIQRLRVLHYAWRTEETYRGWAWRLARFMGERPMESATGEASTSERTRFGTMNRKTLNVQRTTHNAQRSMLKGRSG